MMLMKKRVYLIGIVLGLALVAVGFLFEGEVDKAVTGIAFGIGSGLVGGCLANFIMKTWEDKRPDMKKRNEIDFKDERNTAIRYKAKAKSADITKWFIVGVAYINILIYSPIWVILITIGVFVLYHILTLVFMSKYQNEM